MRVFPEHSLSMMVCRRHHHIIVFVPWTPPLRKFDVTSQCSNTLRVCICIFLVCSRLEKTSFGASPALPPSHRPQILTTSLNQYDYTFFFERVERDSLRVRHGHGPGHPRQDGVLRSVCRSVGCASLLGATFFSMFGFGAWSVCVFVNVWCVFSSSQSQVLQDFVVCGLARTVDNTIVTEQEIEHSTEESQSRN